MDRRWYWAFVTVAALAAVFTGLSLSRDWTREWHAYQRAFWSLELEKAKDDAERAKIRSRSHQFNQIMVAGGRVDRCTTCHLGIEDPRFVKAPQPFRTHPRMPEHRFERFGCTVCHGGQGRATTVAGAHEGIPKREGLVLPGGRIAYATEREDPVRQGSLVQASCGSCHMGPDVKGAPLLLEGKRLFIEKGCQGCHQVAGMGGKVGPDLTLVGERRSDPAWHAKHFKDPERMAPGSIMPSYQSLADGEVQALTAFLLSLREMPTSLAAAVPLSPEAAGRLFPPLPPLRGHWEGPREENGRPNPVPTTPESIAAGKRLYARYCAACHGKEGAGDGPEAPNLEPRPAVFADAGMMAHERDGGLFWKIGEGRRLMPPWKDTLAERDRWNLVNFLRTLPEGPMAGMQGMADHDEMEPHGHAEDEETGHANDEAAKPRREAPARPRHDRPGAPPHGH